jgi:hypothetical protein
LKYDEVAYSDEAKLVEVRTWKRRKRILLERGDKIREDLRDKRSSLPSARLSSFMPPGRP